jgi:hypothetical protein
MIGEREKFGSRFVDQCTLNVFYNEGKLPEAELHYTGDQLVATIGHSLGLTTIFEDGVYVINMQLSKCSFGFEFEPEGSYDPKLFEEVCVPVNVPAEIVHDSYGHPDYNVVIGYRYNGEDIEESLEGELIDRGFDPQLIFFVIKDGVTTIAYSNHNGDEEWGDNQVVGELLKSFL